MTCYNKVNGEHVPDSKQMLDGLLGGEWGWKGLIMQLPEDVEVLYQPDANASAFTPELLAADVRTPDGTSGFRMRFYRDPPSVPNRSVIDEAILSESSWHPMGFSHPQLERLFYADIEGGLIAPATGTFEFGLAVYGSANFYISDELIIDNSTVQRWGTFFFGKGALEGKATINLVENQTYKPRVEFISGVSSKLVKPGVVNYGGGAGRVGMIQAIDPELAIAHAVEVSQRADITFICVRLTREYEPEGWDRPNMDLPSALPLSSMLSSLRRPKPFSSRRAAHRSTCSPGLKQ